MPIDRERSSEEAATDDARPADLTRAGDAPLVPPSRPVRTWGDRAQAFDRVVVTIARILGFLAGILLVTIALITIYEVIARKTGHASTWAFEYANYLFVWAVFLALPFTEADGGQIQIDLLGDRASPRMLRARRILMKALSLAFMTLIARQSVEFVQASFESGDKANTILRTPLWFVKLILPVGLTFSAVTIGASLVRELFSRGAEQQIAADTEEVTI